MTPPSTRREAGSGNIAYQVPPQYTYPYQPWALVFLRCHFSRETGSGSSTADMTLQVQRDKDSKFDTLLYTFSAVGDDADVSLRIAAHERDQWYFDDGDQLLISWTNPDSGNLWYGLTVGYVIL